MRNFIIAAAIALSAPLVVGTATEAATTKIIVKQSDHRPHRVVEKRRVVKKYDGHCYTKRVVTKVRGERIVKMTKVCR